MGTPGEERNPGQELGHYFKTIKELRAQIFTNSVDNVCIILQIGSVHLPADYFVVKYEMNLAMCQSVKNNIHELHKV